MENVSDIGSLLSALTENPAALNAIGSLLGAVNQQRKEPEPPKRPSDDLNGLQALLGALSSGNNQGSESHDSVTVFGSKDDLKNRIALLNALRPFLSENRRSKLELILKLMKLSELGQLSSLLSKV